MTVRAYEKEDAATLGEIFVKAVEQIGSHDYSPAQVKAWAARCPTPARLEELLNDGRIRLVAVNDANRVLAFCDLEPDGHIDFFYCAPEVSGTGVAAALYDALEQTARMRGMTRLYSEASEAARRFFLKRGFVVLVRRDFEISGVSIHNYAVEKTLTDERPD